MDSGAELHSTRYPPLHTRPMYPSPRIRGHCRHGAILTMNFPQLHGFGMNWWRICRVQEPDMYQGRCPK